MALTPPNNIVNEQADRRLIELVLRRDQGAFGELFGRFGPRSVALARRILRDPALAEEAVQDAFVAVWSEAARYDPLRGTVGAWVLQVVRNKAIDKVRREETQSHLLGAETDEPDFSDIVASRVDLDADARLVRAALRSIPAEQRDVIMLMYFEGMTQSTVAEHLRIPLGTVKSRTLLGMRKLRIGLLPLEP